MFFQQYPPGKFEPEKVKNGYWLAFCETGAIKILQTREYLDYLKENPKEFFYLHMACCSFLLINENDAIWNELKSIAKNYKVEVFPLNINPPYEYKEWTGAPSDVHRFDCIAISNKKTEEAEKPEQSKEDEI